MWGEKTEPKQYWWNNGWELSTLKDTKPWFKEYYESKQDKYKKTSLTQRQEILKALRGKSDTLTSTEQHDWRLTSIKTDEENGLYTSEGLKDSNWKQRILYPVKTRCKMITTCPGQLKLIMTVGEDVRQTAQAFCWWEWEEEATTLGTAVFNDVNMPWKLLQWPAPTMGLRDPNSWFRECGWPLQSQVTMGMTQEVVKTAWLPSWALVMRKRLPGSLRPATVFLNSRSTKTVWDNTCSLLF